MTLEQLEEKVNDLARQVAELRQEIKPLRPLPSVPETFGMMGDHPLFDEIIGTMDLKIASICLAHDATLLTRNRKDFENVAGLQIEDWLSPFPGNLNPDAICFRQLSPAVQWGWRL
ncbi:MAG: type II toxin-antitoxin system VapC family toxin [Planctomycetes bacterium]|nr:type II toxin-antitoxin system VapC family toxin [Planctomycetota bacterium]